MVRLFISIALLLPPATVGAATVEDFMIDHAMSALVFVAAGFDALATTNDSTGEAGSLKSSGLTTRPGTSFHEQRACEVCSDPRRFSLRSNPVDAFRCNRWR
jgi:hypothetical protein